MEHYFCQEFTASFSRRAATVTCQLLCLIYDLFPDLQSPGKASLMAVSIRLKYGILRRVFDKHIDKYEYVTF